MNIDRVDLNLLKVFRAIFQEQQLSRAGQRLGLTQPAMSHALKRLRLQFDDELFLRSPRGMEPTAQARLLAEPIIATLDKLQATLRVGESFNPENDVASFKVGMTDYGSTVLLPTIVAAIRKSAPRVSIHGVHVSYTENYQALDDGQIDLAIMSRLNELPSRFLEQELLVENPVCVICRSNSKVKKSIDLKTYLSLDHISVSPRRSDKIWEQSLKTTTEDHRNIAVTVPHFNAALVTVIGTELIATLPDRVARTPAFSQKLRILPLPLKTAPLSIAQVWHRRNDKDPSHRWLRGLCSLAVSTLS